MLPTATGGLCAIGAVAHGDAADEATEFTVSPVGHVRKDDSRTTIVVREEYRPALLRLETLSYIWVLWWFDRNDNREQRAVLQVHPRGDRENPLSGVFATHSPVRPNLIGMTRCQVVSVAGNVIEVESIDALPDTPVIDIKSG